MSLGEPLSALFLRHLRAPERDWAVLRAEVARHLATLAIAATKAKTSHIDLPLARQICDGCLALLEDVESHSRTERRAIQAACTYFVDEDDGIHDLLSVVGLEDDAEVFNHVAMLVGRTELLIDLTGDEDLLHLDP